MQLDVTVALIDFKVLTVDTDQRPACRREPATNINVTQCSDKVNASVWMAKRATKKAYWKYTFVWVKGKHTKQNWLDGMGIVRMLQLSLAIIDLSHKSVPVEIHNNLIKKKMQFTLSIEKLFKKPKKKFAEYSDHQ